MPKAKTIKVKSVLGPRKIALCERHPDHPDGEVVIKEEPVAVAPTRAVIQAIKIGTLVEVKPSRSKKSESTSPNWRANHG